MLLAVALASLVVLLAPAAPARAATVNDTRSVFVHGFGVCDFQAARWGVVWSISNPQQVAGTIGNVRVTPAYPLVGMSNRLYPLGTVSGQQSFPGNIQVATITFDINWDDGIVSYNDSGYVALPGLCGPGPDRNILISVNTICDAAAHEWLIVYNVTNPNPIAGTIGNVRVTPPGRPLEGMSNRLYPLGTVTGTQRIPADQFTASITFDVNWDDNLVTYNIYRPVYIKTTCSQATV